MNGILCLDKPADMTSFRCCAILRRLLGEKKIGHAGTLDPGATGVLPLLVGRGTKALDRLPVHDKSYTATLQFGAVSDTLDIWGEVRQTGAPDPTRAAVEAALPTFRGAIQQVPPMTSALKKDGVRLYDLARQGIDIPREPRAVTIYQLDCLAYDEASGLLTLHCCCSKGTYIRTLCDDLGRLLGCGAVMTSLRRTMAAGFTLEDCLTLEQAEELAAAGQLETALIPLEKALSAYACVTVTAPQATRFCNGGALALERLHNLPQPCTEFVRVYAPDGRFIGLGVPREGELKINCLF